MENKSGSTRKIDSLFLPVWLSGTCFSGTFLLPTRGRKRKQNKVCDLKKKFEKIARGRERERD